MKSENLHHTPEMPGHLESPESEEEKKEDAIDRKPQAGYSDEVATGEKLKALEGKGKKFVPFEEMEILVSYNHSPTQTKNQFVTPKTLQSLKTLNRNLEGLDLLKEDEKPQKVDLGDMSRKTGEAYGPHRLHREGKSVDMRPAAKVYDHRHIGAFFNNPNYSQEKTQVLVDLLKLDPNVKAIYFNDPAIESVTPSKGHDNHLHVEFNQ